MSEATFFLLKVRAVPNAKKTQVVGFVQTVKKVVTSVQSFFEKIKDIIGM